MASIDRKRLTALESRLGKKLPRGFVATLKRERERISEGNLALVTPDRTWDVRTAFGLDDAEAWDQLDGVYKLVGDVMPPDTLPFAADCADNFYCLVLAGLRAGQVVWWDHERDDDDNSVEPVAASVEEFYASLVPNPEA